MRRIITITVGAVLALSACALPARSSGMTTQLGSSPSTTVVRTTYPSATGVLQSFNACDDLLDWTTRHALDRVGPYGLEFYGAYPVLDEVFADSAGALEQSTAPRSPNTTLAAGDDNVLGTNLQEIGVDEPDLVKTDGRRIVAVSGSTLYVVSIDRDRLKLRGSIDLGFWTQDLFLDGDGYLDGSCCNTDAAGVEKFLKQHRISLSWAGTLGLSPSTQSSRLDSDASSASSRPRSSPRSAC